MNEDEMTCSYCGVNEIEYKCRTCSKELCDTCILTFLCQCNDRLNKELNVFYVHLRRENYLVVPKRKDEVDDDK